MSNPSFSNIDLWLFELAEGNLSPKQIEQLEAFLLNHPELDVDRDVWEMAKVEKVATPYPDVASLERKRRPVAVYSIAILALLLIGSGSVLLWNSNSNDSATKLAEQNAIVQENLRKDIENLRNQLKNEAAANQMDSEVSALNDSKQSTAVSSLFYGIENNKLGWNRGSDKSRTAVINGRSSIDFAGNGPSASNNLPNFNGGLNQTLPNNNIANNGGLNLPSTNLINGARPEILSTVNALPLRVNTSNAPNFDYSARENRVGNDNFFVREAKELNIYNRTLWSEDRSVASISSGGSGDKYRRSLKDRFHKFSRNISRMMNNPVALKNSRDPHYHVPGMTANDISFSSAGTLVSTRVQATSRLQWLGKENEQLMSQLSVDGYAHNIRGGWGIQLNHTMYNNGGIHVGQMALTYSPKISVSNWISVEPSFRFKMGDKQLSAEKMKGISYVETERGNVREFYPNGEIPIGRNLWYKDVGVGLLVNTKWFFVGVQADNLFKHKDNIYANDWSNPRRAQNHIVATIGTDWLSRNENLGLSPYLVYQKNEELSELWAGMNFKWNWFNVGVASSMSFEPAASIGMKFDHFSLNYNADYSKSELLGERALSHQVTMRFMSKPSSFGKRLLKL